MARINGFGSSALIPSRPHSYDGRHQLADHFIGGNQLKHAVAGPVKDFVVSYDGHTVITNILIANNGIAAVKEIRSIRKWAYETFGDERAIKFTVMATPEDLAANADYIRMADHYVEVPGGTNNNNYANVEMIVDIAERMDVHAVWAGWGHASENPRLPESLAVSPKKIVFIGPPGSAMRSLGDKISSTIVAQHANVPCIPWSGSGIDQVTIKEDGTIMVDDVVYKKGCVHSWQEGLQKAKEIGFPVMIKASEGGGGKGIRKSDQEEGFEALYNAASGEIPGSPIFIMKFAGNARHLEVQLLADQYGNNISLFSRDCSVQRRHQKIIEEAPVTVAKPEILQAMEKAAVRLGRLVGYVSAGTVEYLYLNNEFYFLELNPRLQVEHPTTEMVSGVNLPAAQLQVAMGIPLHRIHDIRVLYGVDQEATSEIDFDFCNESSSQIQRPKPKGHTIACRITSEDPGEGFKPSSGVVRDLNFRSSSNVWGYFSVSNTSSIHSFSDSQFGHIFAYGDTRSASRKHMIVALKELSIRGDFWTTVEYLIELLEMPDFKYNTITTGWLDGLITSKVMVMHPESAILTVVCGAVCKAYIANEAHIAEYQTRLEKGQVLAMDSLKTIFPVEFIYNGYHYRFTATRSSLNSYCLFINGSKCSVGVRALSDGGLLMLLNGQSHSIYWKEERGAMRLSVDSKIYLLEQENDPTQLRTPSPGKLIKFNIENGAYIKAGEAFAEVEIMKMYLPLLAQEDGIVHFSKRPGITLQAGDVVGILSLNDPSQVKQAQPFLDHLPDLGSSQVEGTKPAQRFQHLYNILKSILDGFDNQIIMESTLKELINVLRDLELPYNEWSTQFSALYSRIPQNLKVSLKQVVDCARARESEFPAKKLAKTIRKYLDGSTAIGNRGVLDYALAPLIEVVETYDEGLKVHEFYVVSRLLEQYAMVERQFSSRTMSNEEVILRLRDENKDDTFKVIQAILSHNNISGKNDLIVAILDEYMPGNPNAMGNVAEHFRPVLQKLIEGDSPKMAIVSIKAREFLMQGSLPSLAERAAQMVRILQSSVVESRYLYGETGWKNRKPDLEILKEMVDSRYSIFGVLPIFFGHQDPWISLAALEVYVRRAYRAYSLRKIQYHNESSESPFIISWDFVLRKLGTLKPDSGMSGHLSMPSIPATPPYENGDLFKHVSSINNRPNLIESPDREPTGKGVIVPVKYVEDVEGYLMRALEVLPAIGDWKKSLNGLMPDLTSERKPPILGLANFDELSAICNITICATDDLNDKELLSYIQHIVNGYKDELLLRCVGQLTFMCGHKDGTYPRYYTFHEPEYEENQIIRHIEPALAFQLELERLSQFNIKLVSTKNRNIHIYEAVGKEVQNDKRYFARAVIRGQLRNEIPTAKYLVSESERLINDTLDVLEIMENNNSDLNHIFLNFLPVFDLQPLEIEKVLGELLQQLKCRLWRLRVTGVEVHINCTDHSTGMAYPLRVVITNTSGYIIYIEMYTERKSEGEWVLQSISDTKKAGSLHLRPACSPYPTKDWLQPKRHKAHLMGTQYVYDFPELFGQAIRNSWAKAICRYPSMAEKEPPMGGYIDYTELVLDDHGNLVEVVREPGNNTNGIVAWIVTARTPEYPRGRRLIIIANDITYRIGSFGLVENQVFYKCTEYARNLGIPRIYISANSGARISLAEEFIPYFSVAWNNPDNPEAGFKYLYFSPEVKKTFEDKKIEDVITEEIIEDGETRHKIVMIVSGKDGHSMECLLGSGLIAGITSRAYEDIFTITLVTCRSVGIGSYLVRLGQRAIQIEGQPIILTGTSALNKVLGREVYTSNLQLGGTQIMYKNGVSHMTAKDDFDGVSKIVEWLAFVPDKKNGLLPIGPMIDPWDRDIVYSPPPKQVYDVRRLITGMETADGFQHGLFDRDSFVESLGGWAKTVVVGRARLGGIPIGVIAVETRMVEDITPADPANAHSTEQFKIEAGGVLYPNSAFKTAQAIKDFNHGEQLPLMILANWRGFSGGQQDMYDEVLKYGSYIIDELIKYEQPVYIYIPPFAELRGGSWVAVDPAINPDFMEMYADEEARAGILEPEGIVNVRYRRDKQLQTMARLDPKYGALCRKLADPSLSKEEVNDTKANATAREQLLLPIYLQVSLMFADLHDRAGCMKAMGVIREELKWRDARRFFYWRVRRRVNEENILKRIATSSKNSRMNRGRNLASLAAWTGIPEFARADREVSLWYEENQKLVHEWVECQKTEGVEHDVASMLKIDTEGGLKAVQNMLSLLPTEKRKEILRFLESGLDFFPLSSSAL